MGRQHRWCAKTDQSLQIVNSHAYSGASWCSATTAYSCWRWRPRACSVSRLRRVPTTSVTRTTAMSSIRQRRTAWRGTTPSCMAVALRLYMKVRCTYSRVGHMWHFVTRLCRTAPTACVTSKGAQSIMTTHSHCRSRRRPTRSGTTSRSRAAVRRQVDGQLPGNWDHMQSKQIRLNATGACFCKWRYAHNRRLCVGGAGPGRPCVSTKIAAKST